jgi:hypothetical protein
MNIPRIPSERIEHINGLPVMPFIPLLLLKMQAWEDHGEAAQLHLRLKQYDDVRDIKELLRIQVAKERTKSHVGWLAEDFVNKGIARMALFKRLNG